MHNWHYKHNELNSCDDTSPLNLELLIDYLELLIDDHLFYIFRIGIAAVKCILLVKFICCDFTECDYVFAFS